MCRRRMFRSDGMRFWQRLDDIDVNTVLYFVGNLLGADHDDTSRPSAATDHSHRSTQP